jgi:hypothetical protein
VLPSIRYYVIAAMHLVCVASQVSVTVRLASLSRTSTTRDPGHHARFVQLFCFLPALHGAFMRHRRLRLSARLRIEGP